MINKLPTSIGNLSSLEKLWLYYNKLSEIPISFKNLKNIRYLNLEENNLNEFQNH